MAVPAHDERDWDFAKKFGLPIVRVVADEWSPEARLGVCEDEPETCTAADGIAVNSGPWNGMPTGLFKTKIAEWLVEKDCAGADPKVLVHVTAEGAELNLVQADHAPLNGKVSPTEWRRGDVLADAFSFTVPKTIALDALLVRVGLYEGKQRWEVTPSAAHDGADRVEVARVAVQGAPPLLARADVHKRTAPIVIDGALDEPDWARAAALSLHAHDGKGAITRATTTKLLWDDAALYLAFEAQDPDAFTPYRKRDDPLYDSEVYEIFIDADGDADVYVELHLSRRVMIVHLIDGTYELFRSFYGAQRFRKGKTFQEFLAPKVLDRKGPDVWNRRLARVAAEILAVWSPSTLYIAPPEGLVIDLDLGAAVVSVPSVSGFDGVLALWRAT